MNSLVERTGNPTRTGAQCLVFLTLLFAATLAPLTADAQSSQEGESSPAPSSRLQDTEQIPLWQLAEDLRSLTFEAQRALFAVERAPESEQAELAAEAVSNIETATENYTAGLGALLAAVAPDADAWIKEALADALQAVEAGDGAALSSARGRVWTGLLWGASTAALGALEAEEGARAADWLRLREFRRATKVNMIHDLARQTVISYRGGQTNQATTIAVVGDDLRDTYFFRLREALNKLEEAAGKGYRTRAGEWTGQLRGYFAILRPDFVSKKGQSAALAVETALADLDQGVLSGRLDDTFGAVADLRGLLSVYQPVDLSPEEFARRSQLLYLFIDLVYIEYRDGVRNGQITIDTEYREALTFRDQAEVFLAELYPRIAAADPVAAERLVSLLREMKEEMDGLGERQTVRSMVEEALMLTEQTLGDAVHDSSGEGIFNVVETLLNEMEQQVARGEYELAESSRIQAYALFDAGPELRLMAFSPDLVGRLDGLFWHGYQGQPGLSLAVAQRRTPAEVAAIRDVLDAGLAEAQTVLGSGAAPMAIITNSAVIVFREGLEAIVILAALLASMVGAYAAFRRSMVIGVLMALAATAATWWIAQRLMLAFSGFGERLEAIVGVIAVGVLLLITNWFFHRVYWKDWIAGFHQRKRVLLGGAGRKSDLGAGPRIHRPRLHQCLPRGVRDGTLFAGARARRRAGHRNAGRSAGPGGHGCSRLLHLPSSDPSALQADAGHNGNPHWRRPANHGGQHNSHHAGRRLAADFPGRVPQPSLLDGPLAWPLSNLGDHLRSGRGGRLRHRQLLPGRIPAEETRSRQRKEFPRRFRRAGS